MTFWDIIRDVASPGAPRHAALVAAVDAETRRLQDMMRARQAGAALHPLDEIAVTAQEVAAGWEH